jgi:DNA modification methylase
VQAPGQPPQSGISSRRSGGNKQRGHSRRHAGFNDRWDAMSKEGQCTGKRNLRDVWTVATQPYHGAHFATFPEEIPRRCILAGCLDGGMVLDPFGGAGTTGLVATRLGRNATLVELNTEYARMAVGRIEREVPMMATVACEWSESPLVRAPVNGEGR